MAMAAETIPLECPPSPVSVSPQTEELYFHMSFNDAQDGGVSPNESPPHKRYKKWYFHKLWTDPSARVPELPSSPEAEAQESAVPDIGPQGSSLTISAQGHIFENHFADKRHFIEEMTNQSVPVWHPGQERYRWGGCKHCAHLSLQPMSTAQAPFILECCCCDAVVGSAGAVGKPAGIATRSPCNFFIACPAKCRTNTVASNKVCVEDPKGDLPLTPQKKKRLTVWRAALMVLADRGFF